MLPIKSLFGTENFVFILDSKGIYQHFINLGYSCSMFDPNMILPKNCISVQTTREHYTLLQEVLKKSQESRVLTVPFIAFDNSPKCINYLFDLLRQCDFEAVFDKHKELVGLLASGGQKVLLTHDVDQKISCNFKSRVCFKYPKNIMIDKGTSRSIAEYFELNFNNLYPDTPSYYQLDGQFRFNASLFALHPSATDITDTQLQYAKKLFEDILNANDCVMSIENNKIVSLTVDKIEKINDIAVIAGNIRNTNITELAFGLNSNILSSVNWQYNSQINEGCFGIHLGVGDGKTGIHIDFIKPLYNGNKFCINKIN
jgi:hypothetical protein